MSDCPEGYEGAPYCRQCATGYWLDVSAATAACTRCSSDSNLIMLLILVVCLYTLAALVIAVLNVKAGANRKSIHSLVFKLALAFVAGVKTYQAFLRKFLPMQVNHKSNASLDPIRWFSLGYVECLVSRTASFPIRFRDGVMLQSSLPFIVACVATALAGILILIAQPLNRNVINRKRRLADLLKKKELNDVADEVGKAISESRTCGIWRYASYDGLDPASWLARFLKDMLPTYIAIGILLYSTQLTRLSYLITCASAISEDASLSMYSYNLHDQLMSYDTSRPLVSEIPSSLSLADDKSTTHLIKFSGIKLVEKVPSVHCTLSDPTFRIYLVLGWSFIVLWGLGVPVLCFSLLKPHAHQLSKPQILQIYGFLHNGYTQTCWFFELVFFARKAAIALGPVFTDNVTTYTQMSIMTSLIFLAVHRSAVPFDRRNLNILNQLDVGGLVCWCSSLTLVVMAESMDGRTPKVIAGVIVLINTTYVLWLTVALHHEIGNWCRSMKAKHWRMPIIGSIIKAYAKSSDRRKEAEPRVMLLLSRNEVGLGATHKKIKNDAKNAVKMYNNGIPQPPGSSEQKYLVQCLVDTFSYFLSKLHTDRINGEMALYILRTALIRSSQRSIVTMEKTALTDMPESEHAAFVDTLKLQRAKRAEAEQARLQKLQTELDAYFAGKDPTQSVQVDGDYNDRAAKQSEYVSLAALFESPALKHSLPISEFYALIYQLGHTSQDTARFEKYQAIKFIHERKEQDAQRARWTELKDLHTQLIKALTEGPTDKLEIEDHAQRIAEFSKKLAYLEATLEFCLYRPLDFVGELTKQEDAGLDPLARRLEPID